MKQSSSSHKHRLDRLMPAEQYIKLLLKKSEQTAEDIMKNGVHPFRSLALYLEHFMYDPTFKRARHLWLIFYELDLPPAKEVEIVFVKQINTYDQDWKWKPAAKAPPGLMPGGQKRDLLRKYEEICEQIREEHKSKGLKYTKEEVRQGIAEGMNEMFGDGKYTEGGIRKHFERLRKKLSKYGLDTKTS